MDINVKTLNKGGVRTAEINIIAHNILQFNIINALYLKLRYCMLLEWGHNIYYDNNNNYINNTIDLSGKFLTNGTSLPDMLAEVENKQKESCGNYDALVGVVKNFDWNLTPEGSYKIKIDLISAGDIAESISINTVLNFKANPEAPTLTDDNWLNPLTFNRSSLDRIIKRFQAETYWNGSLNGNSTISTDTIAAKSGIDYSYKKTGGTLTDDNETYKIDFANLESGYIDNPLGQYYIKLGALLRIIESFLLEYDTSKNPSPPTIFLDYDYDNNFCFTLINHLSLDPKICLIPLKLDNVNKFDKKYVKEIYEITYEWKSVKISGGFNINTGITEPEVYEEKWILSPTFPKKLVDSIITDDLEGKNLNTEYPTSSLPSSGGGLLFQKIITEVFKDNPSYDALKSSGILNTLDSRYRTSDPFKGKLMHVLVNMNFIHKTIEGNIETDGKLSLTKFLDSLLDGIQGALGYINDFVLSYNHSNNSLRILDNTYLANLYDKIDPTVININTLTPLSGSFVLDYSIKSEVFSKQGNALLVGAQTNGNTLVSNGTIFAELYKGTTDRVLTTKTNKNSPTGGGVANTELPLLAERYKQYRLKLTQQLYFSLSQDDIDSFKDSIQDYFKFEIGQYTKKNNISGDRLIPLNLQLTVDGISGLDIHQVFAVNSLALPSDYAGVAGFVVRELTHKINDSGWTTDIGSLTVLKKTTVPVSDIDIIDSIGTNVTTLTQFDNVEEVVIESTLGSFRERLVDIAKQEEQYWRAQGWDRDAEETSSTARDRIVALGNIWGHTSQNQDYAPPTSVQWSALTISSFIASADTGTTKANFSYQMKHSFYIEAGRKNQINNTGYYKSYSPDEVKANGSKIELGDLICYPHKNNTTVDTPGGYPGHCDVVVEITNNEAKVIGGNLSGTLKYGGPVTLDNTGNIIDNPTKRASWEIEYPYHAVIKWSVPD